MPLRRPWRAQGPPLPERRGQGVPLRCGARHPSPVPAPRPAAPCPPPGTFPGASSHLPWRRSWEPRPELPRSAAPRAVQAGPLRRPSRAPPRRAWAWHRGGAEMEPLQMPTFGELAAPRKRPRNTQGPAWASRPAWSPLAPRPPFPLLPDTWGRTIRRLLSLV